MTTTDPRGYVDRTKEWRWNEPDAPERTTLVRIESKDDDENVADILKDFSKQTRMYTETIEDIVHRSTKERIDALVGLLRILTHPATKTTTKKRPRTTHPTADELLSEEIRNVIFGLVVRTCTNGVLCDFSNNEAELNDAALRVLGVLDSSFVARAIPMLRTCLNTLLVGQQSIRSSSESDVTLELLLRVMFAANALGAYEVLRTVGDGSTEADAVVLSYALERLPKMRASILAPIFCDAIRRASVASSDVAAAVVAVGCLFRDGACAVDALETLLTQPPLGQRREKVRLLTAWALRAIGPDGESVLIRHALRSTLPQIRRLCCFALALPSIDDNDDGDSRDRRRLVRIVARPAPNLASMRWDRRRRHVIDDGFDVAVENEDQEEETDTDEERSRRRTVLREMSGFDHHRDAFGRTRDHTSTPPWERDRLRRTRLEVSAEEIASRLYAHPNGLEALCEVTSSPPPTPSSRSTNRLTDRAVEALAALADADEDAGVRVAALTALSVLPANDLCRHLSTVATATLEALVLGRDDEEFDDETDVVGGFSATTTGRPLPFATRRRRRDVANSDDEDDVRAAVREAAATSLGSPGLVRAFRLVSTIPAPLLAAVPSSLIDGLSDPFWKVRYSCAVSLSRWGPLPFDFDREAADALVGGAVGRTLPHAVACSALAKLGDVGVSALRDLLNSQRASAIRSSAAAALRTLEETEHPPRLVDEILRSLRRALEDPSSPSVRREAIRTLIVLGRRETRRSPLTTIDTLAPLIYRRLCDANESVRRAAFDGLVAFGPRGRLLLVEAALRDRNASTRATVVDAIPTCSDDGLLPTLLLALNDRNGRVRRAAASSVRTIGRERFVVALRTRPPAQRGALLDSVATAASRARDDVCRDLLLDVTRAVANNHDE